MFNLELHFHGSFGAKVRAWIAEDTFGISGESTSGPHAAKSTFYLNKEQATQIRDTLDQWLAPTIADEPSPFEDGSDQ